MKKFFFFTLVFLFCNNYGQIKNNTPQTLPFSQSWTNTGLITANDDWSGVAGIMGYRGDSTTANPTGVDPQTILAPRTDTIDVIANQTAPNTLSTGGVAEFEITDPVVALNGSGTADAPFVLINIETTGKQNIRVQYNLRDIDGSGDNAVQQVALQYRVGTTGDFTNLAAGYVADATTGPNLATLVTAVDVTLPSAADNQSVVQIRIITTNAAGNDEWVGVDDISITGSTIGSGSIVTGVVSTPPFCISGSTTASGSVAYTSSGTYSSATFTAYLSDASGSFGSPTSVGSAVVSGTDPSGSISITIPAGLTSGTGYKIRIDCASPAITGSPSSSFEIINGVKDISGGSAAQGEAQATISWGNPSGCYDEIMIVAKALTSITASPSGNGSAYTPNLAFGSGTAFDGGYVVYKGSTSPQTVTSLTNGTLYYFKLFTRYGTTWSSGVEVSTTPTAIPTLTQVILPQYIQGLNGTNRNRVPFVFRVTLNNLTPNATYRYINQIVNSADGPTTNGAGNCIFVNTISVDSPFVRTSGPSLSTGPYGSFTTNSSGSYTGYFITEPSGNARFVPGSYIKMRIRLNDGAGGTTAVTYLTTQDSVKVLNYGSTTSADSCTGIYGNSLASAKDFVFLYDNVNGTGRPLAGTFLESDGSANDTANSYALFYHNYVNGVNKAWGVVIPNNLANGVRRIERRAFTDGSIAFSNTDADGIWPSSANTVNPTGGLTPIFITSGDAPLAAIKTLNLTAMIEGLCDGTSMIPDTVSVILHNTISPFVEVDQAKVVLNSSGNASPQFGLAVDGVNYYIAIKHRNGLQTWSANTPQFSGGTMSYDFTTAAGQAYAGNQILVGSKYCIFSGDVSNGTTAGTQDGYIDIFDDFEVYNDSYGGTYRLLTDLNLDTFVDIFDDFYCYNNSYNGIYAQYPGFPRPGYLKKNTKIIEESNKSLE